jgi:hypothetical protein
MNDYENEDGRPYDYGFDLPDTRHQFETKEGTVSITIVRNWYTPEDSDEPDFKVSWDISYKPFSDYRSETNTEQIVHLPIGSTEDQAINIAHQLWVEDEEATRELNECRAEEEAERRMGA